MGGVKEITKIEVHPERCTRCFICQLVCSYFFTRAFNLSESRIVIDWNNNKVKIDFTEECNECCLCVDPCVYGALTLREAK